MSSASCFDASGVACQVRAARLPARCARPGTRARRRSIRAACPSAGKSPRAPPPHRSRRLRCVDCDEQAVGMVGKVADQPPLRHRKTPNEGRGAASARRPRARWQASRVKMRRRAVPRRAGCQPRTHRHGPPARGQARSIAPAGASTPSPRWIMLRPHVVEQIGKKRQRARILGRFLGGALGDIAGQDDRSRSGRRKKRGRPAHHLAQAPPRAAAARSICRCTP